MKFMLPLGLSSGDRTMFGARMYRFIVYFLGFTLACLLLQHYTGGFASERCNHPDESAHYVSSLAIADYITTGHFHNPVAFMKDYYSHFPKVAIGHWPPFFELLQALALMIFGASGTVALVLQALIAGLCAGLVAVVLDTTIGMAGAVLGGAVVMLSPIFLPMVDMVMADTLLATTVLLAALTWNVFYTERNWRWSILFALAAAAAILTKGTGFGLALMPLIYVVIKKDFKFLFNVKTLAAAVIITVLTVPWYVATYQMAADGFVYHWGWSYTRLAAPYFSKALIAVVGVPCALAYVYGVVQCIRKATKDKPKFKKADNSIIAFTSASLAMLLFAMIAPADLDQRYLLGALPSIAIVVIWGLWQLGDAIPASRSYKIITPIMVFLVVAISIGSVFKWPHARTYRAGEIAQKIIGSPEPNNLVLVSGYTSAEGAFIAAFADQDRDRKYYIVRAQKVLAQTNWMLTDYTLKFKTPEELSQWLTDNQIGWVVIDTEDGEKEFPHTTILKKAIENGDLHATLVSTLPHEGGSISLYLLPAVEDSPNPENEVFKELGPGHLGGVIK